MVVGLVISVSAFAADFEYYWEGNTLTYTILSEEEKTCITKAGEEYGLAGNSVTGSVTLPEHPVYMDEEYTLVGIGDYSFHSTSLQSINIPSTVTAIGISAFENCTDLKSVSLPASLETIGERAFYYCNSITAYAIPAENSNFSTFGGVLFDKEATTLVKYPAGKTGEYKIPEGVSCIGNAAFQNCSGVTAIDIPESVITIDDYAFDCCWGLTEVVLPSSLESIGREAFDRCHNIERINLPNSLTYVGKYAFSDCRSIREIALPTSLDGIADRMFAGCSGLESIMIPGNIVSIGEGSLYGCSKLTAIEMPETVISIGEYAFAYCTGLCSITIPENIKEIAGGAFLGCNALTSVYYLAENPVALYVDAYTNPFTSQIYENAVLYVADGALEKIKSLEPWNRFASIKAVSTVGVVGVYEDLDLEVYDLWGRFVKRGIDGLGAGIYVIIRNGCGVKVRVMSYEL